MRKFTYLLSGCLVAAGFSVSAQTVLFSEDFEGGTLPAGWTQETAATDGGWIVGSASDLSSSSFAIDDHTTIVGTNDDDCNCDKSNDFLKSPAIDISSLVNPYLVFDIFYFEGTYDATENLTIEASTDGGASWSVVSDLGYSEAWATKYIDLSAYAGETSLMIGFRYDDGGGWLFGAAFDNFQIIDADLSYVDVAVGSAQFASYVDAIPAYVTGFSIAFENYLVGRDMIVVGNVVNNTLSPINSFDLTYTSGASSYTKSFSGLNIGAGESYDYAFDDSPVTIAAGSNDLEVEISNINGGVVEDVAGNIASGNINGVVAAPGRMVVAEEGTGSWCGWCVRGSTLMQYMDETYPQNFIGIAIHNGDPMTVDEYDGDAGFNAFPSGMVDRGSVIDPLEFEIDFMNRVGTPASVTFTSSAQVDQEAETITVNTTAHFEEEMNGDYRLAVVLVEDGVTGTTSGYNQANYYAGGGYGPMGGYESMPSTIDADDIVYDHVGRALLDGFEGASGSVPENNAAGSDVTYSVTGEYDEDWTIENLHAVILFLNDDNGEIINAGRVDVGLVGINELTSISSVGIYPNPTTDVSYVDLNLLSTSDVTMQITDLSGRILAEKNYGSLTGNKILPIYTSEFANGIYTVNILAGADVVTKQLVVSH